MRNVNSKNNLNSDANAVLSSPQLKYKVLILSNSQGQMTGRAEEDPGYDFSSCYYY